MVYHVTLKNTFDLPTRQEMSKGWKATTCFAHERLVRTPIQDQSYVAEPEIFFCKREMAIVQS